MHDEAVDVPVGVTPESAVVELERNTLPADPERLMPVYVASAVKEQLPPAGGVQLEPLAPFIKKYWPGASVTFGRANVPALVVPAAERYWIDQPFRLTGLPLRLKSST